MGVASAPGAEKRVGRGSESAASSASSDCSAAWAPSGGGANLRGSSVGTVPSEASADGGAICSDSESATST